MKRLAMLAPLALLGACGGEEPKAQAKAERPQALAAGQWSSNLRVTSFRTMEAGDARLDLPVGTELRGEACVPAAGGRPPAELFAGAEVSECRWWDDNFMMRNGRLMGNATCQRPRIGDVVISANLTFTDSAIEGTVEYATQSAERGDIRAMIQVRGERTGDCPAAGAGDNGANGADSAG